MTLAHFVVTRFCLLDRRLHRRAARLPTHVMDPLAPRFTQPFRLDVEMRLSLLETICLPGLRAQTNRDFTWVLLIDPELDAAARRRLQDVARGVDRVRFVEYRAEAPPELERLGWLEPLGEVRPDCVVTTLNDDDDALPRRYVETLQSHARDLAAQDRLPLFQLAGARRIMQWDMVFTPDAPLGWTGPWRGGASVPACGFSLLCRHPAFDFSVMALRHLYAEQYADLLATPANEYARLAPPGFLQAARDARAGRVPAARDAFFDVSCDAGAVLVSNHGDNCQMVRLNRSPQEDASARRVQGAATFPGVSIDWRAAQRCRRHFRFSRARAKIAKRRRHERRTAAPGRLPRTALALGCREDVERRVDTHLFGIAPNNSGSTFLKEALATCRATWDLSGEGHEVHGYVGPKTRIHFPTLLWASEQRWVDLLTDPRHYDWPRTRKAWYFQAVAYSPEASVFYTKTPPHLLLVDELARRFRNAKFLFMVRNPYAVCEGIRRPYRGGLLFPGEQRPPRGPDLLEAAARHVVTCLEWQRRNLQAYGNRGVFFTYEAMCAEPGRVAQAIRALAPALDDLNLRQRLPVKQYHEMLTDMNARQIARLGAEEFAALNRVFRVHEDLLAWFGYRIMEGAARR